MKEFFRGFVSDSDLVLFERVRSVIVLLPDVDLGVYRDGTPILLSCHILARAVSGAFGVRYADGYFYPNFEHSWVLSPGGHVIDVYPVGTLGGPILVDGRNVASRLYKRIHPRVFSQGRFGTSTFRRSVRHVRRLLNEIKNR